MTFRADEVRIQRAEPAQPETIGDDEQRRERHRRARDHRIEQSCYSQSECSDVVRERPEQVALDRAQRSPGQSDGVRGRPQVARDKGEIRGLDGDIGTRTHGQAQIGLCERCDVVHSVADHGDNPALGLKPLDTPSSSATSSVRLPCAIRRQNARSTCRAGIGRPGERIAGRRARSARCCRRAIEHLHEHEVLRRPVESALSAGVGVTDQPGRHRPPGLAAGPQSVLESVEDQAGAHVGRGAPAQDAAGVGVDDERDVDHPGPRRAVGEVRNPQPVRGRRVKTALDQVRRAPRGRIADRGPPPPATTNTVQSLRYHLPLDGPPGHGTPSRLSCSHTFRQP